MDDCKSMTLHEFYLEIGNILAEGEGIGDREVFFDHPGRERVVMPVTEISYEDDLHFTEAKFGGILRSLNNGIIIR